MSTQSGVPSVLFTATWHGAAAMARASLDEAIPDFGLPRT